MSILDVKICTFCRILQTIKANQPIITVPVRYKRQIGSKIYHRDLYKRRLAQGPEPERPRSVWVNWNYNSEIYAFGKRLGEEFDENTLKKAFIHRSYLDSGKHEEDSLGLNEPTEDLGDNTEFIQKGFALLESHTKACLRHHFPMLPEESVRSVAAFLLSDEKLAYVGSHIGIKDLVKTQEFPVAEETLSKTFHAVVGALMQDQGPERAGKLIEDFVLTQLIGRDLNECLDIVDPMGLLTSILVSQDRAEPEPRLLFESGSQTLESVYMVGIYSDKELIGKSFGESVQIAEEMAARDALGHIFGTANDRAPFNHNQPITLTDRDYQENASIHDYIKLRQQAQ